MMVIRCNVKKSQNAPNLIKLILNCNGKLRYKFRLSKNGCCCHGNYKNGKIKKKIKTFWKFTNRFVMMYLCENTVSNFHNGCSLVSISDGCHPHLLAMTNLVYRCFHYEKYVICSYVFYSMVVLRNTQCEYLCLHIIKWYAAVSISTLF